MRVVGKIYRVLNVVMDDPGGSKIDWQGADDNKPRLSKQRTRPILGLAALEIRI